jgi:hypothetical protein
MDLPAASFVRRHQKITLVAALGAVVACGGSEPGSGQKPPTQGKEAQQASQPRAKSSFLTLDSIPQRARDALAAQAPDFIPWSPDSYQPPDRDSARLSRDEGLSLVRARFRAPNAVDYIVAGYDRGLHRLRGLRIVAILTEPADAYKVITVSEGPGLPDSLAAKPNRYLAIDSMAVAGKVDLLVIPLPLVAGPPVSTERYTWVPERRGFLLVTPN